MLAVAADNVAGLRALACACASGGLLLLSFAVTRQPRPGDIKPAPSIDALLGWFGWPWVFGGLVATYLLAAAAGLIGVATSR